MPQFCYQVLKKVMEGWLPNEEAAPQPDSDLLLILTCLCVFVNRHIGVRGRGPAAKFGSHKSSIQLNSDLRLCM